MSFYDPHYDQDDTPATGETIGMTEAFASLLPVDTDPHGYYAPMGPFPGSEELDTTTLAASFERARAYAEKAVQASIGSSNFGDSEFHGVLAQLVMFGFSDGTIATAPALAEAETFPESLSYLASVEAATAPSVKNRERRTF